MESESNYPAGWDGFVTLMKATDRPIPKELAVWADRFRAAKSLSGINLKGMSEVAETGYFVGLKLTLVDTALEAFERAIGRPAGDLGFVDPDIAYELWESRGNELQTAFSALESKALRQELQEFLDADAESCQESDLRVVLRAFRHLTAHGDFNPSSAGIYTSASYRELLLRLAECALEVCESAFQDEFLDADEYSDTEFTITLDEEQRDWMTNKFRK